MLKRLEPLDAELARAIRAALGTGPTSLRTARTVVGTVVRRLCQDREMVRYLAGPVERLEKAMILLG